jgi:hypothetical protein
LHLQCHASRNEIQDAKQNIIFYALWGLYLLSVAIVALETGIFAVAFFVSNNAVFFRANQLYAQTDAASISLHMYIAESVLFGCSDFIAQCILVRTLTMVIDSIYSSNLQRYTVAGLCGVATSAS